MTLPTAEADWEATPRPVPLEPDAEDIRLAGIYHLEPCPFCGDKNPVAFGQLNKQSGIIGYHVACGNYHCNASVLFNHRDRETARNGAIECWQRRVDQEQASDGEGK